LGTPLHFAVSRQEASGEDAVTTAYMADMAKEAGFSNIYQIQIDDIGWDGRRFLDLDNRPMEVVYKLYPWEWMVNEEFGRNVLLSDTYWIEPIWKMIWSNKAILPIISELFPNHPNILKAQREPFPTTVRDYVKKPILSREGANVEIFQDGMRVAKSEGEYGEGDFIYQELAIIPSFDGNYPIIGSWVVDGESCGMGIREGGLITDNVARFAPHVIV
jgi:glutathionylspermidine synthase